MTYFPALTLLATNPGDTTGFVYIFRLTVFCGKLLSRIPLLRKMCVLFNIVGGRMKDETLLSFSCLHFGN